VPFLKKTSASSVAATLPNHRQSRNALKEHGGEFQLNDSLSVKPLCNTLPLWLRPPQPCSRWFSKLSTTRNIRLRSPGQLRTRFHVVSTSPPVSTTFLYSTRSCTAHVPAQHTFQHSTRSSWIAAALSSLAASSLQPLIQTEYRATKIHTQNPHAGFTIQPPGPSAICGWLQSLPPSQCRPS